MSSTSLRFLDPLVRSATDLSRLKAFAEKADKIVTAVGKGMNLGDIFGNPSNLESLAKVVDPNDIEQALTLVCRLALENYRVRTVTVRRPVEGSRKFDFIHRATSGWKQFHCTLLVRRPTPHGVVSDVFNPSSQEVWKNQEALPEGTQVTIALRMTGTGRVAAQEELALDRWEAVFDAVQYSGDQLERTPMPALEIQSATERPSPSQSKTVTPIRKTTATSSAAPKPAPARKPTENRWGPSQRGAVSGPPILSFKVVINKMDTFVHAGNAHLIITHMRDYAGTVKLYVMRGEKKPVQLDADSIWGAEIRNGETVLFEFFGPQPNEDFVKELGKRVNKYTQMDKVAHE
jgi:hypothetical protein